MQPFNSFLQTSFSRPPNCLIDFNRTHGSARFLVKERGKMLGVLVAIDPHATAAGGGPSTWCSRPFPASSTATGLHRARPPRPSGHPSFRGLQRAVTDAMALEADLFARGDRVASTAAKLHINFRLEVLLGRLRLLLVLLHHGAQFIHAHITVSLVCDFLLLLQKLTFLMLHNGH